MIDESIVTTIKDSCMVLGLRKKGTQFLEEIHGTGFTVDPEGYVVTAEHVVLGIIQRLEQLNKETKDYEMVASFLLHKDEKITSAITSPIKERRSLIIKIKELENYLPRDHDITICRILGKWGNLPYLKLQKPTALKILKDICICGFPKGWGTLNPFDKQYGIRSSPVIQFGKISSLMPNDRTTRPIGIITDIIGVGGSSGSPIINADSGEVIGIAQHVVPPTVLDKLLNPIGSANIGLTWGVTLYFLYDGIYKMIEEMKKIVNENGEPLVGEGHIIKLNYTAGEGSYPDLVK